MTISLTDIVNDENRSLVLDNSVLNIDPKDSKEEVSERYFRELLSVINRIGKGRIFVTRDIIMEARHPNAPNDNKRLNLKKYRVNGSTSILYQLRKYFRQDKFGIYHKKHHRPNADISLAALTFTIASTRVRVALLTRDYRLARAVFYTSKQLDQGELPQGFPEAQYSSVKVYRLDQTTGLYIPEKDLDQKTTT
jgi:hypothetical protein